MYKRQLLAKKLSPSPSGSILTSLRVYGDPNQVIDFVTHTIKWYLVALPSRVCRPRPRRLPIILFYYRGYVCGSSLPLYGPYPGGAQHSASLIPHHPLLKPMEVPALGRDILGAPSLDEFLRQPPDAREFALGGTSQPNVFRLLELNVYGMVSS